MKKRIVDNNFKDEEITFRTGSENIFADLDFPNAEDELFRMELVLNIYRIIRRRKLTQEQAASIMGIDQPKVSALINGQVKGFSTDRLIRFLKALGKDIDIVLKDKPKSRKNGKIRVVA